MSIKPLKLNALGDFINKRTFYSDNPINAIWSEILRFSDYKYLSSIWENGTADAFTYVTIAIRQANEYYSASKVVSLNTKPLLLYYSFLNLTKAFLYLRNECKPSDYHGLSNLSENIDINECRVTTNNGVFLELGKLFDYEIPVKQVFSFEDFCSNAVEIFWDYEQYFKRESNFHVPEVNVFYDGDISIELRKYDKENMKDLIQNRTSLLDDFSITLENDEIIKLKNKKDIDEDNLYVDVPLLLEKHFTHSIYADGRHYLNLSNNAMPQPMVYFGILFILCSIVRYKPEQLSMMLENKETSIKWFMNKLCETIERAYPNLMLNALFGEKLCFKNY